MSESKRGCARIVQTRTQTRRGCPLRAELKIKDGSSLLVVQGFISGDLTRPTYGLMVMTGTPACFNRLLRDRVESSLTPSMLPVLIPVPALDVSEAGVALGAEQCIGLSAVRYFLEKAVSLSLLVGLLARRGSLGLALLLDGG